MKKQFKNLLLAVPVSLSMLVPNTMSVFADTTQVQETNKITYTVRYHIDGTDEVKEVKKTSQSDSQSISLYSRPFQVTDTKSRLGKGYKWVGWSTKKDSTEVEYKLGSKVSLTSNSPIIDLYSVYTPLDQAEFSVKVIYPDGTVSSATKASVTCKNWDIDHPENGYMHESTMQEVYDAALKSAKLKSGYQVKGLSLKEDGSELKTINDSRIDFSNNVTYYLIAEKIPEVTYKVRYHIDGTDEVKEVTKTTASKTQSISLYSRPFQVTDTKSRLDKGYKWVGWSTKKDSTEVEYKLGTKVSLTSDSPVLDLYSVYAPLDQAEFSVKVVYPDGKVTDPVKASVTCKNWSIDHPDDGYMHESTMQEVYDAAIKSAKVKSGYQIKGMSFHEDGSDLKTIDDSRVDFSKNVTYYLIAEKIPEVTYKVRYHIDGTDEVKEVTKTATSKTQNISLYSRPFQVVDTKSRLDKGYKWVGWSTKKDSAEVEYKLGTKVSLTSDSPVLDPYSVYAPLDQAEFNVSVVYPDGTVTDPVKASVTCQNWSIDHPDDGYMHQSTVREVYDAALSKVNIKSGYEVKGLSLNKDGKNLFTSSNSRIDFSKNNTYYVITEKIPEVTYTVRYHIDGTNEIKEVTKTTTSKTQNISLYSRPFQVVDTKSRLDKGYKWIGWSTKKDSTEVEYKLGSKVSLTSDSPVIDLYSVYTPLDQAEFSVKVIYPDGTVSNATKASVTCKNWDIEHPENGYMHESTIKEIYEAALKNVTIKDGYKIKGMSFREDGSDLKTINDSRIDFSNNVTYYLVAEKIPEFTYTVRYHIDGTGEVKEVTKTTTSKTQNISLYSRPFQVVDTKSRLDKGYKWIGWSTKKDSTEVEYKLGSKVSLTSDSPVLDLYSVYAPLDQVEFNVSVVYPDGTVTDPVKASVTCKNWDIEHPENGYMHESTIKEIYEAALKNVTIKDGYKIKGLSLKEDGKELETIDDSRIDFSNGNTYYIVVEKEEEPVTPGEPEKPNPGEDKPSTPEKPGSSEEKPSTPEKPSTSETKPNTDKKNESTTKKDTNVVKTGVEDYALAYTMLALVSLVIIKKLKKEF